PTELDELGKLAKQARSKEKESDSDTVGAEAPSRNGPNMRALISAREMSWGDVGLLLSIPGQGLGNAAIAAVATDEQLEKFS
ncbi:acyl-CoA dehydrogenase, partial [Streptomyces sp. SID10244]|nr:acyl-CoA dehydrogenase [Streptomyces sp. SID10244]